MALNEKYYLQNLHNPQVKGDRLNEIRAQFGMSPIHDQQPQESENEESSTHEASPRTFRKGADKILAPQLH